MIEIINCRECVQHPEIEKILTRQEAICTQHLSQQEKDMAEVKAAVGTIHRRLDDSGTGVDTRRKAYEAQFESKVSFSFFWRVCTVCAALFVCVYAWLLLHDRAVGDISGKMNNITYKLDSLCLKVETMQSPLTKMEIEGAVKSAIREERLNHDTK